MFFRTSPSNSKGWNQKDLLGSANSVDSELDLEFYGPVNTVKIMLSQSVNLLTLFGRQVPEHILLPISDKDHRNDFMINLHELCGQAGIQT